MYPLQRDVDFGGAGVVLAKFFEIASQHIRLGEIRKKTKESHGKYSEHLFVSI